MRLELALIVGILFFCSWCAYIVARMNSSVNGGTSAAASAEAGASASTSPSSSSSVFASSSSQREFAAGVGGGDLSRTMNGSGGGGSLIGHASAQQSRAFGSSVPFASARFTPMSTTGLYSAAGADAGQNWPPYVSAGRDGHDTGAGNYQAHAAAGSGTQPTPTHGLHQQWQSYALPSHAHAAGAPAPAHASQPLLLVDYSGQQPAAAAAEQDNTGQDEEEGEGPEDEGGVTDYPQTAAASGEESVEGEAEAADDDVEQLAPPNTELEEVANRRSFDELQSDSSERDKDGRVVVTKRRHLINGRPVSRARGHGGRGRDDDEEEEGGGEDHERTAASSRVPYESSPGASGPSEADFEKLVDEIDQEDKLRKKAAEAKPEVEPKTGVLAAQSRQHGTRLRAAGARPDGVIGRRSDWDTPASEQPAGSNVIAPAVSNQQAADTSRAERARAEHAKNKAKDTHEHSLQESLTAQQWDDDSATSGGAAIAPEAAPEIGDEEDQEEVANIVERDQEARRLAQMSRDLLLSPERVSRELDQEESRRRRRRRKRETIIRSSVPATLSTASLHNPPSSPSAGAPVPDAANASSSSHSPAGDLSRERDRGKKIDTGTEVPTPLAHFDQKVSLPPASSRADERQTGPLAEVALVSAHEGVTKSGQVDGAQEQVLHFTNWSSSSSAPPPVAVSGSSGHTNDQRRYPLLSLAINEDAGHLAQANNNGTSEPQMSQLEDMHVEVLADPPHAGGPNWLAPASLGAPPLNGHAHQSGPQLASESHKVKKKAKSVAKKRRKKKYKLADKSKMVDSKYKAARAYERKHASRHKKGQMGKKRRKSEKDLMAQKKHFKGATRGNKFARGKGAHGAKKGANFYKDKGYKKRGFKKAYHKLETGDHKTYFDEFRDKDHHKKWKNFDDRHRYSQKKKWAGSDSKHLDRHKLKLAKARASKAGKWRESAANKRVNEMDKYKKYKKSATKSKAVKSSGSKKKKKKKKKKKVES